MLEAEVLPAVTEPVGYIAPFEVSLAVLAQSVRAQGQEGTVAKRRDSVSESDLRTNRDTRRIRRH